MEMFSGYIQVMVRLCRTLYREEERIQEKLSTLDARGMPEPWHRAKFIRRMVTCTFHTMVEKSQLELMKFWLKTDQRTLLSTMIKRTQNKEITFLIKTFLLPKPFHFNFQFPYRHSNGTNMANCKLKQSTLSYGSTKSLWNCRVKKTVTSICIVSILIFLPFLPLFTLFVQLLLCLVHVCQYWLLSAYVKWQKTIHILLQSWHM